MKNLNKISFTILIFLLTCFSTVSGKTKYKKAKNSKQLIILIHGIGDKPYSMWNIERTLYKKNYSVLNFDYASTKSTMDSVVARLAREINNYETEYDSIYFVVHSLGSFVTRSYLMHHHNKKFANIVFIAPPSKGSIVAERFENFKLFKWLYGEAGQKLGKGHDDYWKQLAIPKIPFGIIAGGIGTKHGLNPLIPGDDDGTVGVQETIMEGYRDFIIIPGLHTSLLWQPNVMEQILFFIKNQKFRKTYQ